MTTIYSVLVYAIVLILLVCLLAPLWLFAFLIQDIGKALEAGVDKLSEKLEQIQNNLIT